MDRAQLKGGILFDIQGFSVHDGPGCRTLIFFKGCSLRCRWCSNPEGINRFPEPLYREEKCVLDGLCVDACPYQAVSIRPDGSPLAPFLSIDRNLCSSCNSYTCATSCCTGALNIGGYFISADDLIKRLGRDRPYWGRDGGITLTGGEPFMQPGFTLEILKRSYEVFIHTAVETCGNVAWENIEASLPYLDWIFFDLKHMNDDRHREATGSSNKLLLDNALLIGRRYNGRLIYRLPVVPGFNDDDDNIIATADFIASAGRNEVNILPLHHLGREKYRLTGTGYYTTVFDPVPREKLDHIRNIFEKKEISCYTGYNTPF